MVAGEHGTAEHIPIHSEDHIVLAGQVGRTLAIQAGFLAHEQTGIIIAIMEVARNILRYAQQGEVVLSCIRRPADGRVGIAVVARDEGPGILDVAMALQDGYSTGSGLGLGLPGARRLMDEFEIVSKRGQGTVITMTKWKA